MPSELEPVFTTAADELAFCAAGLAFEVVVVFVVLLELLPHAASSSDTATVGRINLSGAGIRSLPFLTSKGADTELSGCL
ncbi:MAG TPA: hypothetical protein VNV44_08015 [Solirubrobacteraceae bacterium]|nr:hypothetical protein [Solirubrobacteraceae bacterium]